MPARRSVLLVAAGLVALATLGYAFATRDVAPEPAPDRDLEPQGRRAAGNADDLDPCLSLDVRALERIAAELRVGCPDDAPHAPPTSTSPDVPPAPSPDPTTPPDAPGAPPAPPSATPGDAESPSAPTPPTAPSTTPAWPTTAGPEESTVAPPSDDDATREGPAADVHDDPDGSTWTWWPWPDAWAAPEWPSSFFDALAPLLSPPAPPRTADDEAPLPPTRAGECARVCDPRDLQDAGEVGARGRTRGDAQPVSGLLARALDALDAYVRLRDA